MKSRKEIKKKSFKVLKSHYLIYVFVCLISVLLGIEFYGTLTLSNLDFNNNIFVGNRGVLAAIINAFTTETLTNSIMNSIGSVLISKDALSVIMIILSALFVFIIWTFIKNTYKAVSRRIFLEGRIYKKISFQSFTFFISVKKWIKASITLLITTILYVLWCFTIVGIVVKRYSYFLVPFIVAENPDINAKEAITLSRSMMSGHKFECFKLDLSYLGWDLLGLLTGGITKVLFSNPYQMAAYSEFYAELRTKAIKDNLLSSNYLNDTYLYKVANKEIINKTYNDVIELENKKHFIKKELPLYLKVLDILGIKVYDNKYELDYEQDQINKLKIKEYRSILKLEQYPSRLSPLSHNRLNRIRKFNYIRHYSILSLILLFFIFSVGGWIWEVCLHYIAFGAFVKRGAMYGPWLPIYGWGAVLILTLLNKFRDKPVLEFVLIILVCGLVEYYTSVYLEVVHHARWWDYSGYVLNLNGRICAEGLLVFGIGGMAGVYLLAPMLDNMLRKINPQSLSIVATILLILFVLDQAYSSVHPNIGRGITEDEVGEVN